jgi:hypothetical protein
MRVKLELQRTVVFLTCPSAAIKISILTVPLRSNRLAISINGSWFGDDFPSFLA